MKPIHLTARDRADLVEFLKSLTGEPFRQMLVRPGREMMRSARNMKRPASALSRSLPSLLLLGCGSKTKASPQTAAACRARLFHVDPATAGSSQGTIRYTGERPARKTDRHEQRTRLRRRAHGKRMTNRSLSSIQRQLANVFVYIKAGLEGKTI